MWDSTFLSSSSLYSLFTGASILSDSCEALASENIYEVYLLRFKSWSGIIWSIWSDFVILVVICGAGIGSDFSWDVIDWSVFSSDSVILLLVRLGCGTVRKFDEFELVLEFKRNPRSSFDHSSPIRFSEVEFNPVDVSPDKSGVTNIYSSSHWKKLISSMSLSSDPLYPLWSLDSMGWSSI